jgi:hypothetical protein
LDKSEVEMVRKNLYVVNPDEGKEVAVQDNDVESDSEPALTGGDQVVTQDQTQLPVS